MLGQKGYAVPVFFLLGLILFLAPLYFWMLSNNFNFSSGEVSVKGVSSIGAAYAKPGFGVTVESSNETWDLVEFLCVDKAECLKSLDSGTRWETISGGKTDGYDVVVEYRPEWSKYDYIKYYVRSGWVSSEIPFRLVDKGRVPGTEQAVVSDGSQVYDVLLIPVASVQTDFYTSGKFSNK